MDRFSSSLSRQLVSWLYAAGLFHISLAIYIVDTERYPVIRTNEEARDFPLSVYIFLSSPHFFYIS